MSLGHRDGPWLYWRQFLTFRSFLFDCPKVNNLTGQCFPVTCCTFPKNLETFKNSKAPFIMFCFKTTIKEYNFPTPEACRKYENAHSCKKSLQHHSWLFELTRRHSWCWERFFPLVSIFYFRRLRRREVLYFLTGGVIDISMAWKG